jgi:hypothetical protein
VKDLAAAVAQALHGIPRERIVAISCSCQYAQSWFLALIVIEDA